MRCGDKIPKDAPKKPLQEIEGVVLLSQNQDGRLLERAVRKVIGGRIPIYGSSVGDGWDLAAKGAALMKWNEKKTFCEYQALQQMRKDERKLKREAPRLRKSHEEL